MYEAGFCKVVTPETRGETKSPLMYETGFCKVVTPECRKFAVGKTCMRPDF